MSRHSDLPNWVNKRAKSHGPPDRRARFEEAAVALAEARIRNRLKQDGGMGCPILVEGLKDRRALKSLGFKGPIELVNRGWDMGRLCAWLFEEYGIRNPNDGGAAVMMLMDWDRTGGRLQRELTRRLTALDMRIDEEPRRTLTRCLTPETRTFESVRSFSYDLRELMRVTDPLDEEE